MPKIQNQGERPQIHTWTPSLPPSLPHATEKANFHRAIGSWIRAQSLPCTDLNCPGHIAWAFPRIEIPIPPTPTTTSTTTTATDPTTPDPTTNPTSSSPAPAIEPAYIIGHPPSYILLSLSPSYAGPAYLRESVGLIPRIRYGGPDDEGRTWDWKLKVLHMLYMLQSVDGVELRFADEGDQEVGRVLERERERGGVGWVGQKEGGEGEGFSFLLIQVWLLFWAERMKDGRKFRFRDDVFAPGGVWLDASELRDSNPMVFPPRVQKEKMEEEVMEEEEE